MSRPSEPLMDPSGALQLALRSQGWAAGPAGHYLLLAGGPVDARAAWATYVAVFPGTISISTRLPVMLREDRWREATRVCAAISSQTRRAVTIDAGGTPIVGTRRLLLSDERTAAATIAAAVRDDRKLASGLVRVFLGLSTGSSAEVALAEMSLADHIPWLADTVVGSRVDLSASVERPDAMLAAALGAGLRGAEAEGFARYLTHLDEQDSSQPLCVGPLLLHEDGTLECYGCKEPLQRTHPAGASLSCTAGRAFGTGHRCRRCG